MYRDWPFFQTLLSNMDMVLAKSSIAIASRYAELVPDAALRDAIFGRIRAEYDAVVGILLGDHGAHQRCWKAIRCWRAPSATASRISIR